MKRIILAIMAIFAVAGLTAQTRLKDISKVSGMDNRQLIGYGLVVGLQGTGDSAASQVTIQSINNMLEHFGLSVPDNRIRPNNTAAVMVTAVMPPFASPGSTFDVIVSSVGDARSLEGGQLLMTPLVDQDNRVKYAVAQGPVSFGGFNEEARGTRMRRNYTNSGRIPNGAIVESENMNMIFQNGELKILLNNPDFTTAERATVAINGLMNMRLATADNASSITVIVPDDVIMNDNLITFISNIENLEIMPQQTARVVINERTGTIVAGGNVRISPVAIAHGNLLIRIAGSEENITGPFNLQRYVYDMDVRETNQMFFLETATVQELAQALNAIRVSPRDMISIFQAMKESGALLAELRIL